MWLILVLIMGRWAPPSEPFPAQQPFVRACSDPAIQYSLAVCGIQSGKTLGGADGVREALYAANPVLLPKHMLGRTPMEVWFVSKSYQLCETMLETFRWRTPDHIWADDKQLKQWGLTRGDRYTHWLVPRLPSSDPAPIKLRLRTAKDPESLRATPVLGLCWGDETAYWPSKSVENLLGRAIVARTKFVFTTSPRGKDYVYRNIALPGGWPAGTGTDKQMAAFGWASADNPYADKKHLERLRRMLGREYAKQELDGLFTDAIGYVYSMFDRSLHMVKPPSENPEHYEIIIGGVDPGLRDPYAAGIWGRTHEGVWHQLWEFHQTGGSSARFAPIFKAAQDRWQVTRWYVDKRKPSDILDLRDGGVKAQANLDVHAENDTRTIAPMTAICRELMREGKLFIGEDHEWTAEEFEKYHYPDEVDEREKNTQDTPVDWMNHHMDQMRYAICSVEELPQTPMQFRRHPRRVNDYQAVTPRKRSEPIHVPNAEEWLAKQDQEWEKNLKANG